MVTSRLDRNDWLRAARLALLRRGLGAVRIERLAHDCGVTKGSFYWHFPDLAALLEALLVEWEAEAELLIASLRDPDFGGSRALVEALASRVALSELGEIPSDAAIFGWAAADPAVRARVAAAEEERIVLVAELAGSRGRAEIIYMAYLGFILRRRTATNADELFAMLAAFMKAAFDADDPVPLNQALDQLH